MKKLVEIELRFHVPAGARAAIVAEMARRAASLEHRKLSAIYLDTPDRRLARASIAWRLRREGRRWIQTLKSGAAGALERFEHEVIRPGPIHDAGAHAGTSVGDRLIALLGEAHDAGQDVDVRFLTDIRRTARRVRTRGAVVEIVFDEGRLLAGEASQRVREMEFELVSGSAVAMLALAERWRKRFGLIFEPRSKAERGDLLAQGSSFPVVRKAARPDYPRDAGAVDALGSVVDECLAHITYNAIGIAQGDPALRIEHVHQLRVGIRRLRSALRTYAGWAPQPPETLVAGLQELFTTLGASRDSSVLESGVMQELSKVGAPALAMSASAGGPDPVVALRSNDAQRLLLAWITWRRSLLDTDSTTSPDASLSAASRSDLGATTGPDAPPGVETLAVPGALAPIEGERAASLVPQEIDGQPSAPDAEHSAFADPRVFHRAAQRRLYRWHRKIAADSKAFDDLDETALHALRKRIKRQRYAVEFFAPILKRRTIDRYLKPLAGIQERMGELNDLFVARARFQELVATDPAAWFALGWLAARILDVRALAKPELARLARAAPPSAG